MSWIRFISANRSSLGYAGLVGLMPLVFSTAATVMAIRHEPTILTFGMGEWTLFYAAASLTMAFGLTPTTFIALLSGYFLGWSSVPGVLTSYLGASLLGYAAASLVDRGRLIRSISDVTDRPGLIDKLREGEVMFIILARISPFLPFAIMNILLAALRVDLKKFLVAGFAGMLPRTLLFIWLGSQVGSIVALLEGDSRHGSARIGLAVLIGISLIGFYYFFKRYVLSAVEHKASDEQ